MTLIFKGDASFNLEVYDGAIAYYNKALAIDPKNSEVKELKYKSLNMVIKYI